MVPPSVDPDPPGVDPPSVDPPGVDPPSVDPPSVVPPSVDPDPPGVDPPSVDPPDVDPPSVDPPSVVPPPPPQCGCRSENEPIYMYSVQSTFSNGYLCYVPNHTELYGIRMEESFLLPVWACASEHRQSAYDNYVVPGIWAIATA